MRFENQVAVVTGAGRGIGHAIAVRLANEGARVASVSRTEANAKKTAEEINAARPDSAKAYAVDVAEQDAVQKAAAQILEDFGRVDILVNNAGVTRDGLSMRMPLEDWDVVLNTNLKGAFNFTQALMRSMIKQRSGRIINISSVIGLIGNKITRPRTGQPRHHGQRRRPGIDRDGHDRRAFGRSAPGNPGKSSARQARAA
jgi:3-oxoacyl-[acyl-carrier protein] reductase